MLSLSCKTAIKAVVYLASQPADSAKPSIKEIAGFINASEHSVGKLLQALVKGAVINSTKGPNGGFYISEKQKEQPLINIVKEIDGLEIFNECGLGFSKCSASHPCPMHQDYKPVRDLFRKVCKQKTISDLCATVNGGLSYLIG